jgi:alkylation response protein AidB-like acyl-CoA dehydrogenase
MADAIYDLRPLLTDTQEMLREAARNACRELQGGVRPSAIDYRSTWKSFAELGWTGVVLPEDQAGSDGNLLDAGIVAMELGRAAMFVSYPETVAWSHALLQFAPSLTREGRALVADIGAGKAGLVFARRLDPGSEGGDALVGVVGPETGYHVRLVENGKCSLVASRVDELGGRDAATTRRRPETLVLDGPAAGIVLLEGDAAREAFALADLVARCLTCALLVGSGRAILQLALDYANIRAQFGHVIANYQAVQHTVVDVFAALEGAEMMCIKALDILDRGRTEHGLVTATICFARDAVWNSLFRTYDVFGGVAFMEEHPLGDFARGMVTLIASLGTQEECLEEVGASIRKGAFLA